ncbi:hypothetical protein BOTBODRAFT_577883 [Botryobasidium botryosum FD-172 SS1]|uniref:Uncharacterized protein n=1 Tax=Botryobasidium botryosum (strain FD-172 SS1) TaxID=930990 RepID=A0A067MPS7_BOTB1|nr:hypothetical protein BOTBODRAFT_577883 [Botryobasidium botryosum FD-172 SS1]
MLMEGVAAEREPCKEADEVLYGPMPHLPASEIIWGFDLTHLRPCASTLALQHGRLRMSKVSINLISAPILHLPIDVARSLRLEA